MRLPFAFCLLFAAQLSCAGAIQSVSVPSATVNSPVDVLGSVNGAPVRLADLDANTQLRINDLRNEYEQRRFELLWTGVEDIVGARLLQDEATRRHEPLATLLNKEVDSNVTPVKDEDIRALYNANRDVIKVAYDIAAPHLKAQLQRDRAGEQRRALIDRLRQTNDVRYAIAVPELPRTKLVLDNAPTEGPAGAKVTVVLYSDFQCPYSAQARRLLRKVREIYPDSVRLVYRDYPLAQHPRARQAAEAAQCAREQKKFWAYYDMLFDNNTALETADLKRYASQTELNMDAFNACVASDRPRQSIATSEAEASRFGVSGTPVIFVNGMRLIGVLPLPLMQAFIDHELQGS